VTVVSLSTQVSIGVAFVGLRSSSSYEGHPPGSPHFLTPLSKIFSSGFPSFSGGVPDAKRVWPFCGMPTNMLREALLSMSRTHSSESSFVTGFFQATILPSLAFTFCEVLLPFCFSRRNILCQRIFLRYTATPLPLDTSACGPHSGFEAPWPAADLRKLKCSLSGEQVYLPLPPHPLWVCPHRTPTFSYSSFSATGYSWRPGEDD